MRDRSWERYSALFVLFLLPIALASCSRPGPADGSATFDADGTAHIARAVPVPSTISPEAQKWLNSLTQQKYAPQTLAERRASTDQWRATDSAEARKRFPVNV